MISADQEKHDFSVNKNLSEDVIDLYVKIGPQYLKEFQNSIHDKKAMKFHAHKLASVMGTMGFKEIHTLLRQIENNELQNPNMNKTIEIVIEQIQKTFDYFGKS